MTPGLLVILALIVMVVVHELGHFLVARWVGIRASKFYVFFPPALAKVQRGDVEYGIGAIPLGGFVKLPGMFEPIPSDTHWRLQPSAEQVIQATADPALRSQLMSSFTHAGRAGSAEELAQHLTTFRGLLDQARAAPGEPVGPLEGAPRQVYERRLGKLARRVEGVIEDAHPRAYWRAALWRRMAVIIAGPAVNVVVGLAVLIGVFGLAAPVVTFDRVEAAQVTERSPAAEAGLRDGDEVVAWDGTRLAGSTRAQIEAKIRETRGEPVELTFRNAAGKLEEVRLTPRPIEGSDGDPRVGIAFGAAEPQVHHVRQSIGKAWADTRDLTVGLVVNTGRVLSRLWDPQVRKQVNSVVGIVMVADEAYDAGHLFVFMGMISLILAIMNLLPLLPLDGGHLLFGLLEWMRRGRPVSRWVFERYAIVGLSLVLMLFLIGLRNDLGLNG